MKKISKNLLNKGLLLVLFIAAQVQVWAAETNNSDTATGLSNAIEQPKFWIGVGLFIACIVTASLIGRKEKKEELQ